MIDIRFEYKGFGDCDSHCNIKIFRSTKDRFVMVMATELPDNTGTSITHMAEPLATEVCRQYNISPHKLIWIEHYPRRRWGNESFDRVYFDFDWDGGRFVKADWHRLDLWEMGGLARNMFGVEIKIDDPEKLP